jgi:hypothetical protein
MQPAQPDPLAELRDIHLPGPIEVWPPALGWWLVAILLSCALLALVIGLRRRWQKNAYRRMALQELDLIEQSRTQGADSTEIVLKLQQLLKRTAIAGYSRASVASLSGVAWTQFLDATGNTQHFSLGPGELLIDGPYQPDLSHQADQLLPLIRLCRQWISHHDNQGVHPAAEGAP